MSRFVVNDDSPGTSCENDISVDPIRLPPRIARRLSPIAKDSPDGPQSLRIDAHLLSGRSGTTLTSPAARRTASPVRLTLGGQLGRRVDGAWWPHSNRLARELPELVAVLHGRLGEVVDISVNWSLSENMPDLNSRHWQNKHQHLMAITGREASANLLVVPSLTPGTLAGLLLRLAAGMPLSAEHQATPLFRTASEIVDAARAYTGPSSSGALPTAAVGTKRSGTARGRRTSAP